MVVVVCVVSLSLSFEIPDREDQTRLHNEDLVLISNRLSFLCWVREPSTSQIHIRTVLWIMHQDGRL